MNVLAANELEQLKASILALSKTGKYGEAVRKINAMEKAKVHMSSIDWDGFISGWICNNIGEYCCDCDNCGDTGCCWVYCCGFFVLVKCCGGEVAGTCCGCDLMIDECCY